MVDLAQTPEKNDEKMNPDGRGGMFDPGWIEKENAKQGLIFSRNEGP